MYKKIVMWLRLRKVRKVEDRMRSDWANLEVNMALAGMPNWRKKQIRKDIIHGVYTFLEKREPK